MPKTVKSYASDGRAYYKHTGRYNEFKKEAEGTFKNDSTSAMKQKNLATDKSYSAAALTLKAATKELGW